MPGTHRDLYAGPQVAVLHTKTTDENWDQKSLVIHILKSQFCLHTTTDKLICGFVDSQQRYYDQN